MNIFKNLGNPSDIFEENFTAFFPRNFSENLPKLFRAFLKKILQKLHAENLTRIFSDISPIFYFTIRPEIFPRNAQENIHDFI